MATVVYSVQDDTLNGAVSPTKLDAEVRADTGVPIELDGVTVEGDVLSIAFQADLDAGQTTALNAVVAAHDGVPPVKATPPVGDDGAPVVRLGSPSDPDDGKPVVVVSPAREGMNAWITGRGDDKEADPIGSGRGTGTPIRVDFIANDADTTKYVEWSFLEPVDVHDGQVSWTPVGEWGSTDEFELGTRLPGNASNVTAASGDGNINAIDVGNGNYLYTPADGDGDSNLDLGLAVPVPAPFEDGYWDVDYFTGVITPNADQAGKYNLISQEVMLYMIPGVFTLHPGGWFDVDVYKRRWVHQNWFLRLTVKRGAAPANAASLGGWLMIFRANITRV